MIKRKSIYLLPLLIGTLIHADDHSLNPLAQTILEELEGVKEAFIEDQKLYKDWSKQLSIWGDTATEHDELAVKVFDCVKNCFEDLSNELKTVKHTWNEEKKKFTLEIERLQGSIILLQRKYEKDIANLTKKYNESITELKRCKDLVETLEDGTEETARVYAKMIDETRQEYREMVKERTKTLELLKAFGDQLRSFNAGHYAGLKELENKICSNQRNHNEHD